MGAAHQRGQVFAVIRVDQGDGSLEDRITVKEVVTSLDVAQAEVARLNVLNADKACRYFAQATRFFPDGSSAGSRANDSSRPAV